MRRPGGTVLLYRDGVLVSERDTYNCAHCGTTVILRGGADPTQDGAISDAQPHWESDGMGVCLQCCGLNGERGLLCPSCHKKQNTLPIDQGGGCRNFERRLDQYEKRARLRAQLTG
jgi:hypothetical protein